MQKLDTFVNNYGDLQSIGMRNYCSIICCHRKNSKYRMLIKRANMRVTRQLDLVRFMKLQQVQWLAFMSLLKISQRHVIERLSTQLVDSNFDRDSDTDPSQNLLNFNQSKAEKEMWQN